MNNLKHKVFENIKTTEMQKYRVVMFTYTYNSFYPDGIRNGMPTDMYIDAYSKQDAKERVLNHRIECDEKRKTDCKYIYDIFEVHLIE